jgi:hypothetical protein
MLIPFLLLLARYFKAVADYFPKFLRVDKIGMFHEAQRLRATGQDKTNSTFLSGQTQRARSLVQRSQNITRP